MNDHCEQCYIPTIACGQTTSICAFSVLHLVPVILSDCLRASNMANFLNDETQTRRSLPIVRGKSSVGDRSTIRLSNYSSELPKFDLESYINNYEGPSASMIYSALNIHSFALRFHTSSPTNLHCSTMSASCAGSFTDCRTRIQKRQRSQHTSDGH